jgi:formate hydrogenlyase subunit 3/multisubunit Na+/H+ antiporter MnhD subunit
MLNLIYFTNVIKHIYFPNLYNEQGHGVRAEEKPVRQEAPLSMLVPTMVLAVAIVALGIFNGEIISNLLASIIPVSFVR